MRALRVNLDEQVIDTGCNMLVKTPSPMGIDATLKSLEDNDKGDNLR